MEDTEFMRPNIFEIGTKELHQDAFITWLLKYADDKYKVSDTLMNKCGKDFVKELIKKQIPDFNDEIFEVKAGRQWDNIDVWGKVNKKYLIIIEDKTNTIPHSNQLSRYKTTAEKWCIENNYKLIYIYLKTGNESQASLKNIIEEGFGIFNRQDFLNLLSKHDKSDNDIFIDFYERLTRIEKINNEFENKNIGEWEGSDWEGFFQYLEKEKVLNNWGYVNNPNGGFWSGFLIWVEDGDYPVYIQLEQNKLCFKISTHKRDGVEIPQNTSRGEIRKEYHDFIINKAKDFGFIYIKRPNRFGNGNYMTVAIVDSENWLGENNSIVNKEKVIKSLTEYKDFLKTIFSPINTTL
jgi:hypothetical protein